MGSSSAATGVACIAIATIAIATLATIRIGMKDPMRIVWFDIPTRARSSARQWPVQIVGGWRTLTSPYHDPIRFLGGLQIECALQALDPSGNVRALDRAGNHQRAQAVAFQDDALARVAIDVLEHVTQRAQAKRQSPGLPGCDRGRVLHLRRLIDAGTAGGCLLPRVEMHCTQLGHEF